MPCQGSSNDSLAKARAYAQARANATGKPYVVTRMGHSFMLAGNGKLVKETGGIALVCRKDRNRKSRRTRLKLKRQCGKKRRR